MQKPRFSMRLTSLMLVFIILFSLWTPSMFVLGEEEQGEEEQDKPTQVETLNEEDEEKGSDQDQEEVKENPKKEEEPEKEVKEEVKEEIEETPESEEDKTEEKKKEEKAQEKEEVKEEEKEEAPEPKKEKVEEPEKEEPQEEEVEVDELAENIPPVMYNPFISIPMMRATMSNSGLEDTIEVDKWAERILGLCRVFEVNLKITGEPQEAPVDVVLIIDKSGSMDESTARYVPITSVPTANSYYVKINGSYQQVSRYSGSGANSVYRYNLGSSWNPSYRYVKWDSSGDDSSGGNSNLNNPLGKPFYLRETGSRLHFAKQAAVNFSAKVLGSNGIPGSRVSLVTFSGPSTTSGNGAQNQAQTVRGLTNNLNQLTNDINGITAVGGTNTEAGFLEGRSVIANSDNPNSNKVVIMFTDGLPTASNGNRYAESTDINHIHNQRALAAGKGIFEDGVADVFTIGLLQGMSTAERNLALHILDETQNKGWFEAPTAADLDQIFDEISTQLGYAATNAKVVDEIGEHFELVQGSLPAGATYNPATRKISWNPGVIVDNKQLTYRVKAKSEFAGGLANTNEYAELTYTDIFGNDNQKKDFPVPEVDVPTLLEASLTDATITLGDSITLGTGTDPSGENYMSEITGGDGDGNYTYKWEKISGPGGSWTSNEANPSVSPTEDSKYKLTITDSNGCKAVAEMTVFVRQTVKVTIKKKITGNYADMDQKFEFTLWIDEEENEFELGHENTKTFEGILVDSSLELKEDSLDYEVTVKVGSQEITATDEVYTIPVGADDITIEVTNHKEVEVDTGISLDTLPYILVIALAAGGLGFMIVRRRKFNN